MYQGIIAPITTPFDRKGRLRLDALQRNIEKYAGSRLTGALVLGTTGEAVHLTVEERLLTVRAAVEAAPERFRIICGLPGGSLAEARAFLDEIPSGRVTGVLAAVPGYYRSRMSSSALRSYFEKLAETSPLPLLLYNIPKFSGIELEVSLVKELCGHPNIAGLKESSGNLVYLQKLLEITAEEEFSVWSGSAETFGPATALGVPGGILAVACVLPDLTVEVFDRWRNFSGDWGASQRRLFRTASTIVGKLSVPGVKYAMDLRGFEGLYCREPLQALSEAERREVEELLGESEH